MDVVTTSTYISTVIPPRTPHTLILLHCIWVLYLPSDPVKRVQWMPDAACLVALICRMKGNTQGIFQALKSSKSPPP